MQVLDDRQGSGSSRTSRPRRDEIESLTELTGKDTVYQWNEKEHEKLLYLSTA